MLFSDFSVVVSEVLKLNLLDYENQLIKSIMKRAFAYKRNKHVERYDILVNDYLVVCGILYNHQSDTRITTSNQTMLSYYTQGNADSFYEDSF